MIGAYLIGDDHFVHVVILQQFPYVLFGDVELGGLDQHEVEYKRLLYLYFSHVVIDLADYFIDLRVLDDFLASNFFLGEHPVSAPGRPTEQFIEPQPSSRLKLIVLGFGLSTHDKLYNILPKTRIPPKLFMLAQLLDEILILMPDLRWYVEQVVKDALVIIDLYDNGEDVFYYRCQFTKLRVV